MASRNLGRGASVVRRHQTPRGGHYRRSSSPVAHKEGAEEGEEQQEDGEEHLELLVLVFVGKSVRAENQVVNWGLWGGGGREGEVKRRRKERRRKKKRE